MENITILAEEAQARFESSLQEFEENFPEEEYSSEYFLMETLSKISWSKLFPQGEEFFGSEEEFEESEEIWEGAYQQTYENYKKMQGDFFSTSSPEAKDLWSLARTATFQLWKGSEEGNEEENSLGDEIDSGELIHHHGCMSHGLSAITEYYEDEMTESEIFTAKKIQEAWSAFGTIAEFVNA